MKISVASEGNIVSGHFGHCDTFRMYNVEGNKVVSSEVVANPGHRPGFLPVFLRDQKVDVIIAGGMGAAAQDLFNQNGIEVVVGVRGNADDAVAGYLNGTVKSTGSVCHAHEHEGHCED
ncbi:NifB/NifX family molybdenum-iron cluster-binding protein [Haloimpatiens sp. FM7330]|uniref:NifB/NifX family molybdenum-iron cluster-binding protein n=1 Tax=Haloimpatiens sp. FM7330 TaxID=3298610 RepID=UPI0036260462